ncbi:MAG: hypothetical protein WBA48_13725 [Xanthobacteraceae bacterium]
MSAPEIATAPITGHLDGEIRDGRRDTSSFSVFNTRQHVHRYSPAQGRTHQLT